MAVADIVVTVMSFIGASYLRNAALNWYPFGAAVDWHGYWDILLVIVLVWRGLFIFQGAYTDRQFTAIKGDLLVVSKTIIFGSLIVLTVAFVIQSNVPRSLIAFFAVLNFILLASEKVLLYRLLGYLRRHGINVKKVLVLGVGDVAKTFIDSVEQYPDWGIKILGLISKRDLNVGEERFGYKIVGHTANLRELLHYNPIDELVIALPAKYLRDMEGVMALCDEEGVTVRIVSSFFKNLIAKAKTDMIHGIPIVKFSSVERDDFELTLKRVMDIIVSFVSLVLLVPIFGPIAMLIKRESPGPVFYRWKVLGLNKRPLVSYKFRTMAENADDVKEKLIVNNEMSGTAFKMSNDPRITRVGKWLRKFSIDELPQLWSVLKGDMSLVGQRPPLQTEVEKYEGWHRRKLSVKPGITCLWQVNGRNEINDFDEWMRLDMKYIDEWSLWLDFKILFKTAWVVVRGTGR